VNERNTVDQKSSINVVKRKKKKYLVKKRLNSAEIEEKKKTTTEEKFYWVKAGTGAISAFFGVFIFRLVGWWLLIYMLGFLLIWPFFQSFVIFRLPYKKDRWDWKEILKSGMGGYFFIFMLVSTMVFTLMHFPEYSDRLDNPATTQDIAVIDNIAYIADGQNGFLILDNKNNIHREQLHKFNPETIDAQRVVIHNNLALVADWNFGLHCINVSDLQNVNLVGGFQTSSIIYDIFAYDNIVMLAVGEQGMIILDITNISQILVLNNYTQGNIQGIYVEDEIGYLNNLHGLDLINMTDPSSPYFIGSIDISGEPCAIDIENSYAYIASGNQGLHIVNITDPYSLTLSGSFNTTGNATDILIDHNVAYIADGASGLVMLDISDPSLPVNMTLSPFNTIGTCEQLDLDGDYVYIADGVKGITAIYLPYPGIPPEESAVVASKTISMGWIWAVPAVISSFAIIKEQKKRIVP